MIMILLKLPLALMILGMGVVRPTLAVSIRTM